MVGHSGDDDEQTRVVRRAEPDVSGAISSDGDETLVVRRGTGQGTGVSVQPDTPVTAAPGDPADDETIVRGQPHPGGEDETVVRPRSNICEDETIVRSRGQRGDGADTVVRPPARRSGERASSRAPSPQGAAAEGFTRVAFIPAPVQAHPTQRYRADNSESVGVRVERKAVSAPQRVPQLRPAPTLSRGAVNDARSARRKLAAIVVLSGIVVCAAVAGIVAIVAMW
ncbi:MAG TPA: hypothetical protein GX406_00300 [Pseudoclavibacter sp.]|nr:hypothetical protein [Pseudoclavibacter sp.]